MQQYFFGIAFFSYFAEQPDTLLKSAFVHSFLVDPEKVHYLPFLLFVFRPKSGFRAYFKHFASKDDRFRTEKFSRFIQNPVGLAARI